MQALSKQIHGKQHPWTIITNTLLTILTHESARETTLTLLGVLRTSFSMALGVAHPAMLCLQASFAEYLPGGSAKARCLLDEAKRSLGKWHQISLGCMNGMLRALWEERQYSVMRHELVTALAPPSGEDPNLNTQLAWRLLICTWRYNLAAFVDKDWEYAAAVLTVDLIPSVTQLFGDASSQLDMWLLRYEEALEASG
jgi:hypothetical protein